jgi:N-acetyl-gamma-glutamyl-phosphate reductase
MDRGILTVSYSRPRNSISADQVMHTLREFYAKEPFVQVVDHLPGTKDVSGTNYCHITARIVRGRVLLISVIDNLIKGASGAAVQNMNLMFDQPETTSLV